MSCNSTHVIYLIHCNKCKLRNVGSTTSKFKIKFKNYKPTMKTIEKTCKVAIHFSRKPHILLELTGQCIDQIQTNTIQDTEKLLINF